MAEQKSTVTQVRESLAKARRTVDGLKAQGTMLVKEGGRSLVEGAAGLVGGIVDQRYGKVTETGIRVHTTGDAPTVLVAGAFAKIGAALGIAGDADFLLFGAGGGAIGHGMGSQGRMIGERWRQKDEKSDTKVETKVVTKASEKKAA